MVDVLSTSLRERRKMAQWLRLLAIRLELITKNPQEKPYQGKQKSTTRTTKVEQEMTGYQTSELSPKVRMLG
jgi:hypothetical protein